MAAYYNEFDTDKAEWLQNLMDAGQIAPGDIDTRSITDVQPADLLGYTQHHFFAGIGVWSAALRKAGWSDDRPVWTFSCPCPPFSTAGKGQECPSCGGRSHLCHPSKTGYFICLDCGHSHFADARHLYPEISRLAREFRPTAFFGEQVASIDGRTWLTAVRADMENMGYAVGASDLCSAGIGAPNIRQRLYFVGERVGYAKGEQCEQFMCRLKKGHGQKGETGKSVPLVQLAHTESERCGEVREGERDRSTERERVGVAACRLGDADGEQQEAIERVHEGCPATARTDMVARSGEADVDGRSSDWLFCRDGKWRPVEPGTFPLAAKPAGDLGHVYTRWHRIGLKGYGDGLNLDVAATFIGSSMPMLQ
jgi:DNA (cytosine-5)-methyltransferase 1